jgi:hypothetical protein
MTLPEFVFDHLPLWYGEYVESASSDMCIAKLGPDAMQQSVAMKFVHVTDPHIVPAPRMLCALNPREPPAGLRQACRVDRETR